MMGINIMKEEEELEKIKFIIPAIIFDASFTKKQFIIFCYLLYLSEINESIHITPLEISEALDFSPSSIINHLRTLNVRGYIGVSPPFSNRTNKYDVVTISKGNL
jgi:DNA-binding MarR family transcriptional regulator